MCRSFSPMYLKFPEFIIKCSALLRNGSSGARELLDFEKFESVSSGSVRVVQGVQLYHRFFGILHKQNWELYFIF